MRAVLFTAGLAATALAGAAMAMAPDTAAFRVGVVTFGGSAVVTDLPTYGEQGTDIVDYRHGATLRLDVPLTNTGKLPLTVTSADLGGERLALLNVTGGTSPVTLGPGETRTLRMDAVLGNCRYYHEREVRTYDAVRVRYAVLGRTGERRVDLARPMIVHSPMIVGCPDRKLNRQFYNRAN